MLAPALSLVSLRWRPRRPAISEALLRQLVLGLIAAALLEITLLRLATRVGVHVPRSDLAGDGIQAASLVGSLAFNAASILAIGLTAVLLVLVMSRVRHGSARLGLAMISGALMVSLSMSLVAGLAIWDLAFGVAAATLVLALGATMIGRDATRWPSAAAALMVGAYLCYQYYSLSHVAYRMADYAALPPMGIDVLRWGEVFVVLAGLAAFWAWGRPRWRRVGPAGTLAIGAIVAAVWLSSLAPSSTTSILALWTTGLSFFLPGFVYLAVLALYLVTIMACLRDEKAFWQGAGLLLLLVAGYMPEATYHHLLVILGIGSVVGSFRVTEDSSEEAVATALKHNRILTPKAAL